MKNFWTGIIKPLVEGINPKMMVEIGVDKGENTKNILEYCLDTKCKLISIDPCPDNSVSELEYEYENRFTLIRDLSLNVLPDIEDAQIFFIDGDHNWYTVYNELMVIQDKTKENFPLIFLHDVEWPYARRDLYYYPNNIPTENINTFAQRGIDLYSDKLTEEYGFNDGFNNALKFGNAKNGVLTAAEDFLNHTDLDLKFIKIPGFHGLGIIYDQNIYMENNRFKRNIDDLMASVDHINDYLHKLSYANYELLNRHALFVSIEKNNIELSNQINNLNEHINELENNLLKKNGEIGNILLEKNNEIGNLLLKKNEEIDNLKSKLSNEQQKIRYLELNIKTLSITRKGDIYKNFRILFSKYLSNKPIQKKSKLAKLSNIPYLFILFKSKGNMKKAFVNIKGYRSIKRLGLFDEFYYLNKYKNVLISGFNPLIHYIYYGYNENKSPSAIFDGEYYLNKYEKVKASGINPLIHYSLYGIKEKRKTKPLDKRRPEKTKTNQTKLDERKKKEGIVNKNVRIIKLYPFKDDDPLISIIILNKNGVEHLKRLFKEFKENCKYPVYEIIVVDNGSTDESVSYLKTLQDELPIKIIKNSKNKTFSEANNDAVNIANGEYVLLLNNDIEPTFGWLNEMMQTSLRYDNVGAVGAKLVYPNSSNFSYNKKYSFKIQHAGIAFKLQSNNEIHPFHLGKGLKVFDDYSNIEQRVAGVTGAVLLVKKDIYKEVGGLDENYYYGYEDVDFNLKLLKNGYSNIYCPKALLFHYESGTLENEYEDLLPKFKINEKNLNNKWYNWLYERTGNNIIFRKDNSKY